MNKILILVWMLLMHCVEDFGLQPMGICGQTKRKSWWKKQPEYKSLYKNDYLIALIVHSFVWGCFVMTPIYVYNHFIFSGVILSLLIINVLIHTIVDHLKANLGILNLVQDQLIHLFQLVLAWLIILF